LLCKEAIILSTSLTESRRAAAISDVLIRVLPSARMAWMCEKLLGNALASLGVLAVIVVVPKDATPENRSPGFHSPTGTRSSRQSARRRR